MLSSLISLLRLFIYYMRSFIKENRQIARQHKRIVIDDKIILIDSCRYWRTSSNADDFFDELHNKRKKRARIG
jgi:hypothetical protein